MKKIEPLAQDEQVIFRSDDPQQLYCYSPHIITMKSGRLALSFDLGGEGVLELPGIKAIGDDYDPPAQAKIYTSDDQGQSWQFRANIPGRHCRLFEANGTVYILGHAGMLVIAGSSDQGDTWSDAVNLLNDDRKFHQAPCSYVYANESIYIVMEERISDSTWPGVAPILLSARLDDDLLNPAAWRFSNSLIYDDEVKENNIGAPLFEEQFFAPYKHTGVPGWLESNLIELKDPRHLFYDPEGKTFYLWMRFNSGFTNMAAIARGIDCSDGALKLELVKTPGGAAKIFAPTPGGHMKFFIMYDEPSKLYFLLSSQSTDSMVHPLDLPPERFGMGDSERHRLQLHFSRNCFDWCFAGLVAVGENPLHARHYASMTVVGDDLLILSRSADENAKSAHDGNLITLHKILNFRELIY